MIFVLTGFIMEFYNMQSLMAQLANQLYSFETPTELTDEDKNVLKFGTRQQFLQNIFKKIFSSVKKISLNPSYLIYRLSFQKLLKTDNNILLYEAMQQILDRLHEVDKMKKVLFTEEQKKIFEFSYKPTFNLELINKKMMISQIQQSENERLKLQKQRQQIQNKQPSLIVLDAGACNQNNQKPDSNMMSQEMQFIECVQKQDFSDIVKRVSYFKNKKNLIRVNRISQLLIEEGFLNQNQNIINFMPSSQIQNLQLNFSTIKDDSIDEQSVLQSRADLGQKIQRVQSERSQHGDINAISVYNYRGVFQNQSVKQEDTPLQQYLNQGKARNNNLLLSIVEQLRPQTFYSQRVDYSKFSAFYELYEACQISINSQKNTRSSIKVTEKIIEFLGKDIREVFQLAKSLQDERELQKQQRVNNLVKLFIRNIKIKMGKPFNFLTTNFNDGDCLFAKISERDQNQLQKDKINVTTNDKTDRINHLLENQISLNQQTESNQLYNDILTSKSQWNEEKSLRNYSIQHKEFSDYQQSTQNSPSQQKQSIEINQTILDQIKKQKYYQINNPQRQQITQNGDGNKNSLQFSQPTLGGNKNVRASLFRTNNQFESQSLNQIPQNKQEHFINQDIISQEQIDRNQEFEQDSNNNEEQIIRIPSDVSVIEIQQNKTDEQKIDQ